MFIYGSLNKIFFKNISTNYNFIILDSYSRACVQLEIPRTLPNARRIYECWQTTGGLLRDDIYVVSIMISR